MPRSVRRAVTETTQKPKLLGLAVRSVGVAAITLVVIALAKGRKDAAGELVSILAALGAAAVLGLLGVVRNWWTQPERDLEAEKKARRDAEFELRRTREELAKKTLAAPPSTPAPGSPRDVVDKFKAAMVEMAHAAPSPPTPPPSAPILQPGPVPPPIPIPRQPAMPRALDPSDSAEDQMWHRESVDAVQRYIVHSLRGDTPFRQLEELRKKAIYFSYRDRLRMLRGQLIECYQPSKIGRSGRFQLVHDEIVRFLRASLGHDHRHVDKFRHALREAADDGRHPGSDGLEFNCTVYADAIVYIRQRIPYRELEDGFDIEPMPNFDA